MAIEDVTLATGGTPRFVGRTSELELLRALLDDAKAGEARLVLVGGEPGIGKTSLVREFLAQAETAGWQTVWGRCSEDADSPHLPFRTGLIPQFQRAGLLKPGDKEPVQGEDLFAAAAQLAELTVALADKRSLVAVVDDVQFAEIGTLTLVREYVRHLADTAARQPLRVLFLVTHHPPLPGEAFGRVLDRLRSEPFSRSLELTGMTELEVHELMRSAASATSCDPRLVGTLLQTTAGNPFFVLEMLRSLQRQALLVTESGQLATRRRIVHPHLPATALVSVAQRLGLAPERALAPLQTGALLGMDFSLDDLRAFHATDEIETAIDTAVQAGWVVERGDGFAFSHGIIRTATLESMGPLQRRRAHARIATELISRHGTSEELSIQIANHVEAAGTWSDERQAGELFERAGAYAMDRFAWATGLRFYEAALACPAFVASLDQRRLGLLFAQAARASSHNGDHERARERHRLAMEAYRSAGDLAGWGLQLLGWWRIFTNFHERLPDDGAYEAFLEAAGDAELEVRIQLAMHRAEAASFGRSDEDVAAGEEALRLAQHSSDPQTRAYAEVVMGLIRLRHLEAAAATEHFLAGIRASSAVANPRVKGWGAARLAMPLILNGELSEARAACSYARKLAIDGNDLSNGPVSVAVYHTVAVLLGDFKLAKTLREEGAMHEGRGAQPDASFILHSSVAWERLLRGEFAEAADALARSGGRGRSRAFQLLLSAKAGQREAVGRELEQRPLALAARGVDNNNLGAAAVAAELAGELNDAEIGRRALELLDVAIQRELVFCGSPPLLLPRAAAIAARVSGHTAHARELLDVAQRRAQAAHAEPELGLVALERARLGMATDRPRSDIKEAAVEAGQVFRRLDMVGASVWLTEFVEEAGLAGTAPELFQTLDELSSTEVEVLERFARGAGPSVIADALLLSQRTVEATLARLNKRLNLNSPYAAEAYLKRRGRQSSPARTAIGPLSELTTREREVLLLVARGLTNQQIADELVISLHTAIRHVANILGKTGAANRTEAARLAGD